MGIEIKVEVHIKSGDLEQEDIQDLLQTIRDWEQMRANKTILIFADMPDLSAEETRTILESVRPPFPFLKEFKR